MKRVKQLTMIWIAGGLLTLMYSTAMAASRTEINSVSLKVESEIEAGDSPSNVDAYPSSDRYNVSDVEVANEPEDEWDDDDKPKLKVVVDAEDDYYFPPGFSKSDVDLSGADGRVTSMTKKSSTLFVYITLDSLEGSSDRDLDVYKLEWDESSGIASWEDDGDARKYEVRLYRNDNSVISIITTSDTSCDFSKYITRSGDYTFKMRGVYSSSDKGSREESDAWHVSSEDTGEINTGHSGYGSYDGEGNNYSGAWLRDNMGWWYCNADKSYTVSNWQLVDGQWYFFNAAGYMVTGRIPWNGVWYYCGDDGTMYHNTATPDGYYVRSDGDWVQ